MAKRFKKTNAEKVSENVGNAISWFPNVVDSFLSLFGVNLKKTIFKDWMKMDWDLTTMTKAINDIYGEVEIKDAKQMDRINKGLENIIGLAKSPVIKKAIGRLASKLKQDYSKVLEHQGRMDVNKTRAAALASDIDSAKFGDVTTSAWNDNMRELQRNLTDTAVDSGSDKAIETAKDFNKHTMQYENRDQYGAAEVEERL